jgi:diacylglycerol O-acyltransferase
MGHELRDLFPMVPLARNQALGVAIMSYNGKMNFGLVGDYDAMHDLDDLADDFRASLAALADTAGVKIASERGPRAKPRTGATA